MSVFDKNIRWVILIILIFAAGVIKVVLRHAVGVDLEEAIGDAGISVLLMSLGSWGLLMAINAYPTRVGTQGYAFFMAVALAGITCLFDIGILKWWLGDNPLYRDWLAHTTLMRFFICLVCFGWIASLSAMQKKMAKIEADYQQHSDAETLHREAELFKLRQQLQPHFLYNSLNSINALIMIQPDKAQEMIGKLSDFLRSSVRREANEKIPITEELEYIEAYLSIETIRFGDRLQVEIKKDYTDDASIPPFLLQPVLENAIKFGLYGKTGTVKILLYIGYEDSMLEIHIVNPFDEHMRPPSGTGFGLEGIRRRLYLLYARADLLETLQEDGLFTTILKIPQ
ncbi:sensor histidine kinase [Taibaiella soli]|uniref:Sensor histidine kinase n=1 Tax=Taibaiella soli TaxID=1649169 RepID=A0A2W2BU18_9BACT|nr:histidine kinase [Taibaiella soli]PZF71313.1 sensor histidine kinase [Taibaiella soli]